MSKGLAEYFDTPMLEHIQELDNLAIKLYFKHVGFSPTIHHFLWEQCSEDVRSAWRTIAAANLE